MVKNAQKLVNYLEYENHFEYFQDWSLRIQRVEPSDSGAYKCQANSHPPQFITTYLSIHGESFKKNCRKIFETLDFLKMGL